MMATDSWCRCWRTTWEYDHMADGDGNCKHCRKPIAFFHMKKKTGNQRGSLR